MRTHFMLFVGVVWPNKVLSLKIDRYVALTKSLLSIALPKYTFPCAWANVFNLTLDVD